MAKVSCTLCHRGVQLILAYNWARLAILVAVKGRGGMFLFLLFLLFLSCSSLFPVPLFHLLCYLFNLFSPFLWPTRVDLLLNPNTINQIIEEPFEHSKGRMFSLIKSKLAQKCPFSSIFMNLYQNLSLDLGQV